jgi:hypothetical protein
MGVFFNMKYFINKDGVIFELDEEFGPNAWVHFEPNNPDYYRYLDWVEQGNEPVDIIDTPKELNVETE